MTKVEAVTNPGDDAGTRYMYRWLLLALVFEYSRPGSWVPGVEAIRLNSLIPLGLLAVTIFSKSTGLRSAKEIMADPLAKWMIAYLGLVAFSLAYAEVTLYAVDKLTTVLGYIFLFWIISRVVTTPERIRGVFLTLIGAHLFLLAMNPALVLDPTTRHYIDGATFLGDGNDFALSLCILLPFAIELGLASTVKWRKILYFVLAAILLLAVVGTQSRGATLAAIAVTAYLWWHTPRKLLSLCIIAIVVGGVSLYASDVYFQRMGTIANYEEDESATARIEAWKGSMRMWAANPLLGVGAGQFATQYGANYRLGVGGRYMTAHSMYFLTLGELGTAGIVTLLTLIYGNMGANNRARKKLLLSTAGGPPSPINRILLLLTAGMLGFAVAGTFLSVSYYPHIFVLTGLFVSARAIAKKEVVAATSAAAAEGTPLRRVRQRLRQGRRRQLRG